MSATAVPAARSADGEADSLLTRIRAQLPEFTGALRRVADHVLADPAAAARATIVELA
ncbi:MAG: RpiR family transcriptional regulator, partial [Hamadaea sp.]|nr:RpiR family transcriptional regulator [Hamadaea sp.]